MAFVDLEQRGSIGILTMNRPEALNALNDQVLRDLDAALEGVLASDPRPSYQNDPARVYGMEFGALEVRFSVEGETLTVREIRPR